MSVATDRFGRILHPQHEVDEVLRLVAEGLNNCQISRATGINRTTVRDWRRNGPPGHRRGTRESACPRCDGALLDEPAYAYLLGLYLGDGHIVRFPRAYCLRIVQDKRYTHLIELAGQAISRVRGDHGSVGIVRAEGCVVIWNYWKHWPCVFPQHGPGRKHERSIRLTEWQNSVIERYPAPTGSWTHPLGWLSRNEPGPAREVRVSAVLLHQRLGRHPPDLPRCV